MDVDATLTGLLTATYDECFDDCRVAISLEEKVTPSDSPFPRPARRFRRDSTADAGTGVQNETAAADQRWRTVVNKIREFRRKVPPAHVFECETGKDTVKGLRELEVTAQEHLDLHEGLRLSLQSLALDAPSRSRGESHAPPTGDHPPSPPPPPLPPRLPPSPTRAAGWDSSRSSSDVTGPRPKADTAATSSSAHRLPPSSTHQRADRSASPGMHRFRRTLRTGKPSFKPRDAMPPVPGANKAAAAAWIARDARPTEHVPNGEGSSSVSLAEHRRSAGSLPPQTAQEQYSLRYDRHTRRLVPRYNPSPGSQPRPSLPLSGPVSTSLSSSPGAIGTFKESAERGEDRSSSLSNSGRPSAKYGDTLAVAHARTLSGRFPTENLPPHTPGTRIEGVEKIVSSGCRPERRRALEPTSVDDTRSRLTEVSLNGRDLRTPPAPSSENGEASSWLETATDWAAKMAWVLRNLPSGVEKATASQILDEIEPQKDVVHWRDIAGLEEAKNTLKEAVVYPFLRPDLFRGLREPPRGILLFGPPGTGKTMLARAVATESESTYIAVTASTLNSKYLGESEKHVRALFTVAKMLAPSIIFVDEVDSILSQRSSSGEHEASRRLKTEFLIQWSSLDKTSGGNSKGPGDNRVLVLAATNRPWDLDDAATRRFARRQYIPLPEAETRRVQLRTLLGSELKHRLSDVDIDELVRLTDGYSGSDITHLARQASYGPLRSHGEAVLRMTSDEIRPVDMSDFVACLRAVRPSVDQASLQRFEGWAEQFGERIG